MRSRVPKIVALLAQAFISKKVNGFFANDATVSLVGFAFGRRAPCSPLLDLANMYHVKLISCQATKAPNEQDEDLLALWNSEGDDWDKSADDQVESNTVDHDDDALQVHIDEAEPTEDTTVSRPDYVEATNGGRNEEHIVESDLSGPNRNPERTDSHTSNDAPDPFEEHRRLERERVKLRLRKKQEVFLKRAHAKAIRVLRRDHDFRLATEDDKLCLQQATGVYARLFMELYQMEIEAMKRGQEIVREVVRRAAAAEVRKERASSDKRPTTTSPEEMSKRREAEIEKRRQIEDLALIRELQSPPDQLAEMSLDDKLRILRIRGNVPLAGEMTDDAIAEALKQSYANRLY